MGKVIDCPDYLSGYAGKGICLNSLTSRSRTTLLQLRRGEGHPLWRPGPKALHGGFTQARCHRLRAHQPLDRQAPGFLHQIVQARLVSEGEGGVMTGSNIAGIAGLVCLTALFVFDYGYLDGRLTGWAYVLPVLASLKLW